MGYFPCDLLSSTSLEWKAKFCRVPAKQVPSGQLLEFDVQIYQVCTTLASPLLLGHATYKIQLLSTKATDKKTVTAAFVQDAPLHQQPQSTSTSTTTTTTTTTSTTIYEDSIPSPLSLSSLLPKKLKAEHPPPTETLATTSDASTTYTLSDTTDADANGLLSAIELAPLSLSALLSTDTDFFEPLVMPTTLTDL